MANSTFVAVILGLFILSTDVYFLLSVYNYGRSYGNADMDHNSTITEDTNKTEVSDSMSDKVNEKFVIYNLVPKCGSTLLQSLVRQLSEKNGFERVSFKQRNKRVEPRDHMNAFESLIMRYEGRRPRFYDLLENHIDLRSLGGRIIYFSLIRDPVARFVSSYYFHRHRVRSRLKQLRSQEWSRKQKDIALDWLQKPLSKCVRSPNDHECNNFAERKKYIDLHHPHRIRLPSFVSYFCGGGDECQDVNRKEAVEAAIKNIDNNYLVVGVLEQLEMSFAVLEHKIPEVFKASLLSGNQIYEL